MIGGRLMAGQGTLDPSIEVRILTPEPVGPLAQRQSGRLITGWSQVRILQGPWRSEAMAWSLQRRQEERSGYALCIGIERDL